MTLQNIVRKNPNSAILVRYDLSYLEQALQESNLVSNKIYPFYLQGDWQSPQFAIEAHGPRKIYFLIQKRVEYEGILHLIEDHSNISFGISNCRKLFVPLPVDFFKKLADQDYVTKLSNFSIVQEIDTSPQMLIENLLFQKRDLLNQVYELKKTIFEIAEWTKSLRENAERPRKNWPYTYVELHHVQAINGFVQSKVKELEG